MASRPDMVKTVNAVSYPYALHHEEPFVPPVDYPLDDLWLRSKRRPPTPPTDYQWDKSYPFVAYGNQQNFHNQRAAERVFFDEPEVDYYAEPVLASQRHPLEKGRELEVDRKREPQPKYRNERDRDIRRAPPPPVRRNHENHRRRYGNNINDCPICAAEEQAYYDQHYRATVPVSPNRRPVTPRQIGGVNIFPPVPKVSPGIRQAPRRPNTLEFDFPVRKETSSEDDFDDSMGINGDPYQQERRQMAYLNELVDRRSLIARALVDRVARAPQELTITRGEVFEVLNDQKSWWKCCNVAGRTGYIPFNILKLVTKADVRRSMDRVPQPDYRNTNIR